MGYMYGELCVYLWEALEFTANAVNERAVTWATDKVCGFDSSTLHSIRYPGFELQKQWILYQPKVTEWTKAQKYQLLTCITFYW